MLSEQIEIINQLGLHARAAAKLVTTAAQFSSEIRLQKDGKDVDAKSIMSVMMLAASRGTTITIHAAGEDEKVAMEALMALIQDRFGEAQ
jgi:phosphocarrier protein